MKKKLNGDLYLPSGSNGVAVIYPKIKLYFLNFAFYPTHLNFMWLKNYKIE